MSRISPEGIVERTVRAWRRLGNVRSSMYRAAPVAFSTPSLRRTFRPTTRGIRPRLCRFFQTTLNDPHDRRLFGVEACAPARQPRGARLQRGDRRAVHVRVDDRRMDVALPADGFRLAEPLLHRFARAGDLSLRVRLRREGGD